MNGIHNRASENVANNSNWRAEGWLSDLPVAGKLTALQGLKDRIL